MRKSISEIFDKNKNYFFILLAIIISTIIGNIIVFFKDEDLVYISSRTDTNFLMIYMIIGIIGFRIIEKFRGESFTIRDILKGIATLFLVYFVPLLIWWDDDIARGNITEALEGEIHTSYYMTDEMLGVMFRGWKNDETFLQSDWFVQYRYVALVFLFLLVTYLIKSILIEKYNCRDGFMTFLVVVIMSTSIGYLYLDKEAQRKETYVNHMDEIEKYTEILRSIGSYSTKDEMVSYLEEADDEDLKYRFYEIDEINEVFDDIVSGWKWKTIYEEGEKTDFEWFKLYSKDKLNLSEEEAFDRLYYYLGLSEEERKDIAFKEIDLFLEEFGEQLKNKSFKSYLGIYTEDNLLDSSRDYLFEKEQELKSKYLYDH